MAKDIRIRVTIDNTKNTARITIRGDLTGATGKKLLETYTKYSTNKQLHLELNFDEKCYINSGGIAYLIDIATSAKKANQKIKVTGLSDHFEKIFQMVGLTRCMELGE
ncbi:MAG: STAS domain-containing protein [Desulfobulbaceae bacterium]|nr:STAS domain-containing protein [Desulfobulbaceae bacterium]